MRLRVIVGDMRQVLARNSKTVGEVIIPSRNYNLLGLKLGRDSLLVASIHPKSAIATLNALDAPAQAQFQRIMLRAFAVILERLSAGGLFCGTCKRQIPDFEQFRRGEEDHIDRIVIERIA